MAVYCVGDVQGCDGALRRLMDEIGFSASRDHLYLLGDLVNRGPNSTAVLRRCICAEGSISVILGNHDLHLLARYYGVRKSSRRDTIDQVIQAPDADALMAWLRQQPLARQIAFQDGPLLMVHAGVLPQWTAQKTLDLAQEVHAVLADAKACRSFIEQMYGNQPDRWSDKLKGKDRLRAIVNALTRLRFCSADGRMDFESSENADKAPPGLMPWFEVPGRKSADTTIAFGHWSTLGLQDRANILALDTGCVWGGCLSAMRFGLRKADREVIQVPCEAAQKPG
ncbi:symmetrical bis(5'-nucleosyl)-tetraphosphatase [Allofranklinella schreckenbergeri]|uniref:bis(5'-nucleosyl)-tetraphosphatase (symmetrical) n=1 Tax=Allofranklinella schreckenbergeri TaxID=1076744 RepID=A0A3M6QT27_9BURK|nr:symmetrical bis(5'-nucleosyl)-tetraphosphatase [Allofranklinella schreckenbergeri]RMX06168.1 symmetrical bis(5'-nucleosyl)-tetraphosphatase [Allofranklinella schreckenbergeri]